MTQIGNERTPNAGKWYPCDRYSRVPVSFYSRGRVALGDPDRVAIPLANGKLIRGNIINNHIRYKTTEGTTLLIYEKGILT